MAVDLEDQARAHVDWLLDTFVKIARPLMLEEFKHGFKHGMERERERRRSVERVLFDKEEP